MNGAPSEGLCITEQRPRRAGWCNPRREKALARAKPAREAPGESRDQTPEAKIRCRFDEHRVCG
jgi:hypothetical protein